MTDKNIIFLISQPRSGSTLTQKIIGSHSEIYTRGEPWLMLPPAYSLKQKGITAQYDAQLQHKAFNIFLDGLAEGRKVYINEIKKMSLNLYSGYLKGTQYNYFLDKTPRYYLITNELQTIFPQAHFILLIRNPLAVLGSMINTWTKNNWGELSKMKYDLIEAIEANIKILTENNSRFLIIHYEKLILDSEQVFQNIFDHLNLTFEKSVLSSYSNNKDEKWAFGDPSNVYEKKGIDSNNDSKWQAGLIDPQYWRVMYDYLIHIGEENFTKLGYDFTLNMNLLKTHMPAKTLDELIGKTSSLFSFFVDPKDRLIQKKEDELSHVKQNLTQKEDELANIYTSKKWKLVSFLAMIKRVISLKKA